MLQSNKVIIYTTATITLGTTLLWLWSKWSTVKSRRRFRKRNLEYVEFPGLITQSFAKIRFELEEYKRVQQYGSVFATRIFGQDTIFVAEPQLAQLILSKEFTSFTNRRIFNFDDPVFSSFLSLAQDEQWKRIRSIVTPTFSTGAIKKMKPRIDDTIETLLRNIEDALAKDNIINVKEFFGCFTMDTIMQVAFGLKINSLLEKNNPIIAKAKKLFGNDLDLKTLVGFFIFFLSPKLAKLLNINNDVMDFFKDFSIKVIAEKREELKQNAEKFSGKASNFIELLLEAEAENEKLQKSEENGVSNGNSATKKSIKFMNNDEIIANCILFFIAAYDTTNSTISLASYFVATHPAIQERLYEESVTVIEKLRSESSDDQIDDPLKLVTPEALSQFEYLNAVVSETLRYYPPASLERTASKDIELATEDGSVKLDVKKGDIIHFPVYSMHRNVADFPDPETFNPERFIGTPSFHKYSYLPFGSGPRNCVARSLALLEAKMALLSVVYRYKLSPCSMTKIPVEFYNNGQVLTPKAVYLKFEKR